jgi:hypothetical protein
MSLVFVQGDTAPDITSIIHEEDNPAIAVDLSQATGVRFQMRKADDKRFTVNAAATVTDGPNGHVLYSWGANDLATPGEYEVQWEVTYSGGRIQTTAPTETITIRRQ